MMIGTCDRRRSSRQTSMPDTFGSMTSSSTRSGFDGVEHLERLGPVAGHLHPEALALQADGERLDEGLLVLDDEDRSGSERSSDVSACLSGDGDWARTRPGVAG